MVVRRPANLAAPSQTWLAETGGAGEQSSHAWWLTVRMPALVFLPESYLEFEASMWDASFCAYGRNRMGTLRRNWIRVIYLLSGALLVLIIGTLGIYWLWQAPAVLAFGGAVAVPLARALLKAIQKFRW